MLIIWTEPIIKNVGGYVMNNKNNSKLQSNTTSQAQSSTTDMTEQAQSVSAKAKASKSEYGTLTAKSDANNDYK